jgi:hypothetical protein
VNVLVFIAVARPPRDSNQLSLSLIPVQSSFSPTVASLAPLKLATLVRLHSNLSRLWPNYSIVGIVEFDNSARASRIGVFKMKSIELNIDGVVFSVLSVLVLGIPVKKKVLPNSEHGVFIQEYNLCLLVQAFVVRLFDFWTIFGCAIFYIQRLVHNWRCREKFFMIPIFGPRVLANPTKDFQILPITTTY